MPPAACALCLCSVPFAYGDPWPSIPIPPGNARALTSAAPRPAAGDVEARARTLFAALHDGTPEHVESSLGFFLQRDPFLAIKDMHGALGYFNTLTRAYRHDIETARREWPAVSRAEFVRFDLSRACTWMSAGREANRLPYWSCYRSHLVARAGREEHRFEVRVMINWGDRWFVTHLGPIPGNH